MTVDYSGIFMSMLQLPRGLSHMSLSYVKCTWQHGNPAICFVCVATVLSVMPESVSDVH